MRNTLTQVEDRICEAKASTHSSDRASLLTRRRWLRTLVMLSLGVFGIRNASSGASTPTCEDTINKFQCLFNAWVEQVKENNPNILDAKHPTAIQDEIATWQVVRHEWRGFEKQINKMYGI